MELIVWGGFLLSFLTVIGDRNLTSCRFEFKQTGFLSCLLEIKGLVSWAGCCRSWVKVLFLYMVWLLFICTFSLSWYLRLFMLTRWMFHCTTIQHFIPSPIDKLGSQLLTIRSNASLIFTSICRRYFYSVLHIITFLPYVSFWGFFF